MPFPAAFSMLHHEANLSVIIHTYFRMHFRGTCTCQSLEPARGKWLLTNKNSWPGLRTSPHCILLVNLVLTLCMLKLSWPFPIAKLSYVTRALAGRKTSL